MKNVESKTKGPDNEYSFGKLTANFYLAD